MLLISRVNGDSSRAVPADDRGLAYGDGVFRTIRLHDGRALDARGQVAHLLADAAALALEPPTAAALLAELNWAAGQAPNGLCKLILSRGGGRGYRPQPGACRYHTLVYPAPEGAAPGAPIRVRSCSLRLGHQPRLAGIKHLNRLENVLARNEWDPKSGIEEGILCDSAGVLVGGTMSNLFWVEGDTLYTPDLERCGVAGRQRARVIAASEAAGQRVSVVRRKPEDCRAQASELFVTNAVWGLRPVIEWDAQPFAPGPIAQGLSEALAGPQ